MARRSLLRLCWLPGLSRPPSEPALPGECSYCLPWVQLTHHPLGWRRLHSPHPPPKPPATPSIEAIPAPTPLDKQGHQSSAPVTYISSSLLLSLSQLNSLRLSEAGFQGEGSNWDVSQVAGFWLQKCCWFGITLVKMQGWAEVAPLEFHHLH